MQFGHAFFFRSSIWTPTVTMMMISPFFRIPSCDSTTKNCVNNLCISSAFEGDCYWPCGRGGWRCFFQCVGGKTSIQNLVVEQQKPPEFQCFFFCFPGVAPLKVDHACMFIANKRGHENILPPPLPEQIAKKSMDSVVRFVFATVGQLGVFHRTLHNVSMWKNIPSGITHYPVL